MAQTFLTMPYAHKLNGVKLADGKGGSGTGNSPYDVLYDFYVDLDNGGIVTEQNGKVGTDLFSDWLSGKLIGGKITVKSVGEIRGFAITNVIAANDTFSVASTNAGTLDGINVLVHTKVISWDANENKWVYDAKDAQIS